MSYTQETITSAVFKIISPKPGTCFLIRKDGNAFFFLTANHVVRDGNTLTVVHGSANHHPFELKVIQRLESHDVALLYGTDLPIFAEPLPISASLQADMRFTTYGFPRDIDINRHTGTIMGRRPDKPEYEIRFDIKYDNHLGGLSGAPVYDENFEVVGVMTRHLMDELQHGRISPCSMFMDKLDFAVGEPDHISCYVISSDGERNAKRNEYTLRIAVRDALGKNPQFKGKPIHVEHIDASDAFNSEKDFIDTVKNLCTYEVAIFDITGYEPAVMFLLGIRSVVRRGVTIVSVGGDFTLGDVIDLPFNIKEVNVVSHSAIARDNAPIELQPRTLLRKRIEQGLEDYLSPKYQDLPTFEFVRSLLPNRREKIPYDKGVLVLCSYSQRYQKDNWRRFVKRGFERQRQHEKQTDIPVHRILDFSDTGRLISHTMYEYIRRVDLCIIDWTEWRPNVFFETGIRLAVSGSGTYIILEDQNKTLVEDAIKAPENTKERVKALLFDEDMDPSDERVEEITARINRIAPQCQKLLSLFSPLPYQCDYAAEHPYDEIVSEHASIQQGIASYQERRTILSKTYQIVSEAIDPITEYTSIPVYNDLIASADLYDVYGSKGISSVLYPKLNQQAQQATIERLLAAWYYITHRYTSSQVEENPELHKAYWNVRYRLGNELSEDERKGFNVRPIKEVTFLSVSDLLEGIKNLKNRAKNYRNEEKYEEALNDLRLTIELLEAYKDPDGDEISEEEQAKIQAQIADSYGMMGGVYRRAKDLENALEQYNKGLEYETDDSYNLGNAIVLDLLLHPEKFPQLSMILAEAKQKLYLQTQGARKNQWWAWADMGLLYLLNDALDMAKTAYANFKETGARPEDYNSTIGVLQELKEAFERTDKVLVAKIADIIDYLAEEKSRLKST